VKAVAVAVASRSAVVGSVSGSWAGVRGGEWSVPGDSWARDVLGLDGQWEGRVGHGGSGSRDGMMGCRGNAALHR
jgi:hypothetical protein